MRTRWIYTACLFLLVGISSNAAAEEPKPITLKEARTGALENSPTLMQARLDEKAAGWGMLSAVSDALPHVNFKSSYVRLDEDYVFRQNIMRDVILQEYGQYIDPEDFPPFAYRNMYSSSVSVDQPIYNGGVEITALRIAGTRKRLIHLTREVQEREIILAVETAYYNLCRAYQAVEVQKRTLEVTQGYLDRFRRQQELGLISPVDILRWEAKESSDEAALVEARNTLKLAELSLARAMGSFGGESYYPADLPEFLVENVTNRSWEIASLETLWENTMQTSPDLQMAQGNVKLEKHNVWLTSANFQPKLNFNYTYSWQADDDIELDGFTSWTAGVSLSMPLFASFGSFARWQEARVNVKKAREGVRDFEAALHMRLTAAYNDWTAALSRLKSALKMSEQTGVMLSTQEKRHELGMITTLELLDARAAELAAGLGIINARFDALIARASLTRIAGNIGTE